MTIITVAFGCFYYENRRVSAAILYLYTKYEYYGPSLG